MADKRMNELGTMTDADLSDADLFLVLDDGTNPPKSMRADELAQSLFLRGDAIGSQAEAELGASNSKLMTPLRTAQAIAALASGGLTSVQVLTASGTYTRPAGITKVLFFITGGGAGGGDPVQTANSGATAIKFLDVTSIASSTIVIGAGGAGNNFSQSAGSNSSWSDGTNTITAEGGKTGTSNTNATGGDLNISGADGSFWGGAGLINSSFIPQNANAFGAAGAGGDTGNGSRIGGSGKSGVLFVMEFA
jgi:hypothetical protein